MNSHLMPHAAYSTVDITERNEQLRQIRENTPTVWRTLLDIKATCCCLSYPWIKIYDEILNSRPLYGLSKNRAIEIRKNRYQTGTCYENLCFFLSSNYREREYQRIRGTVDIELGQKPASL